jgi:uncharacterized protein (DUF924 family)
MSSFTLDKDIFNPTLYKQIQDRFFEGHSLDTQEIAPSTLKRFFGGSPEEKKAFDDICRAEFGPALESISAERFPNPSAEPFVQELKEVAEKHSGGDGSEIAWTALSIALLLDQVTRNIFRTNEGLFKVYNHYDKIVCPLMMTLLSSDSPIGRPDLHPQWRQSLIHRMWFYLPLTHSEDMAPHDLYTEIFNAHREELVRSGANEGKLGFLTQAVEAETMHREILEKFGRYPHRNHALGRQSTPEEEKFLAEGGATFGVAQVKKEA